MSNYQRYQTLCSEEQYLFSPSCPVWVQKYQLSWDAQTGTRLLQCRMVNVSEKTLTAVYLRVLCRDEQGQDLTMLHLVPVTGLLASPGMVFGDDRVVTLWPKRAAYAEVYAERVCFADGTAWNEPALSDYCAIPAPAPVRPQDPAYVRLAAAARAGGVRNDYYFRAMQRVWMCTCGLPNSSTVLRCRHCGADRLWLEQHMDLQATVPEPKQTPKPEPAPEPQPRQEPTVVAQPLEKFDLASYLAAETAQPAPTPREEFPLIDVSEEPQPRPKKRRTGRIVAIVLALLLFLGLGAWFGYRRLLAPYLKYQDAYAAESDQDYERAISIYRELGDYQDSAERIVYCEGQIALDLMREERYAEAYERLKTMPGYEEYAAACLYSQGVNAYNAGDLDTAWRFVGQLQTEAPTYEKLRDLHDCCCYGFGKAKLDEAETSQADPLELVSVYEEAKTWFLQAGDYSNSEEMIKLCDYYVAGQKETAGVAKKDSAYLLEAAQAFASLGNYSDSAERRLDCMYQYVEMEKDPEDELVVSFLEELIEENYRGAEKLYDELFRMEIFVDVRYSEPTNSVIDREHTKPIGESLKAEQMSDVWVFYEISGGRDADVVQLMLIYTLPGSPAGSVTLNPDNGRSGAVKLYELLPAKAEKEGEIKLQFYNAKTGESLRTVTFRMGEAESPKTGS